LPHGSLLAGPGQSLGLRFAALAVALMAVGYLLTDTINWSHGFGWDGVLYGTLAQHFPSAVAGTGTVLLPGIRNPSSAGPHGLDSYYTLRALPSALAYLLMTGSARTVGDTIRAFSALNTLCLGIIAACWWGIARRTGLTRPAAWLGLVGLLASFTTRTVLYYPVLTDMVGFCLGALAVYLWIAGNNLGLFAATVAAGFAWPSEVLLGMVLLIWPYQPDCRPVPVRKAPGRPLAAAAGLITFVAIAYVHHLGWLGLGPWRPSPMALLGGALACALFAYAVIAPLIPTAWHWFIPERTRRWRRVGLAVLVPVIVLCAQHLISVRPGQGDLSLFGNGLSDASRLPGLFLVAGIGYYGPLLLIGVLLWPRVARLATEHGPGMAIGLALAALFLLFGESRKDLSFFPLEVFAIVGALDRSYRLDTRTVAILGGLSLVASRLWLPIGTLTSQINTVGMSTPAMVRLFASAGVFTTPRMYGLQLVLELLVGGAMVLAVRSDTRFEPTALAAES